MTTYKKILTLINNEITELTEEMQADREELIDAFLNGIAEDLKRMPATVKPIKSQQFVHIEGKHDISEFI